MSEKSQESNSPEKRARLYRLMNVFAVIPAIVGILTLLYFLIFSVFSPKEPYLRESFYPSSEILIIPLILLGASSMIFLMRYLQTGAIFKQPSLREPANDTPYTRTYRTDRIVKEQENKIIQLQSSLAELQAKIPEIITSEQQELAAEQQEDLLNKLKARIESLATEELLNEINQKASNKFEQDSKIELLDESCAGTFDRLNKETAALSRRGNLNLVLGIFTTIIGLFVLYVYVSKISIDATNPWIAGVNFLPRLSLVILIELFAYFFLKLYKANLSEIKYFQNELTNIEAKYVSLRTAILSKDEKTVSEVIKDLSKTERNFILEKGQSTVDLEQLKVNNEATSSITKSVSDMIKNIKLINK